MLLALPLSLAAQDDFRGWTFYGSIQGNSNDAGWTTKFDPSVGYRFNQYFEVYAGLPAYVTRDAAEDAVTSGIGNAYAGGSFEIDTSTLRYYSDLSVAAPTGDESKGFSTGRVTADWTHTLSRTFSVLTPFVSAGIGTTPHAEGGAIAGLGRFVTAGASAYAVGGSESEVQQPEAAPQTRGRGRSFQRQVDTAGSLEFANDYGVSTWVGVSPTAQTDFHVGYSRSVEYELNSVFFGIAFRIRQ